MNRFSRRGALGLIGGAATLPMLGTPALANTKMTVGALRFTSHAASFVAFERGYFTDEGLDVEFKFFEAAQPMAVAIASGDADYAVTAITGGLISLAEKGAAKVIGGALSEEKGIDGQMILASNAAYDAGLTSAAALDGRSFAVTQPGSSFHYMGAKIAAAEGASVKFTPLQKVGAIIGALKSGQVDAWTIVPHIGKALSGGGAVKHIGMVADYLPDYQVTTVFTSASNASGERAQTEAFLRAFSRGAADFNAALVDKTAGDEAGVEMVKLVHKYVYADQPFEKAEKSIRNGAMRLNKDAGLNMGSVEDQLGWFKSEGLVKDSITTEVLVDGSYAPMI
ncbi:ABC transporter substrate-binding protein [Ruegeria pomeroyi]|uniref:ABC transporter substrate-binding protein n=1 Tax=Ruegeria alba TaxID=2916756 RepID=A0ABS9P0H2_9RHOB|nr:ABC transporter substrate-binding protein [Ruegeria alba]MCE8514540.1 ABC transporter substrate-binding protein [Ruegeria pomeroyi]MCE8523195.1 ABC transporter substrate-binding protein [Ruegeria pomeroyi]MCE8530934.1 ABC transporter substrate-binding protein [Ruegeria pomeroyi]MCE8533872.1 ABC transporter substrate-binding protein [Ruegeria pomeroyi]MCG6559939.1 ABC transporter substrate-binding protein [Ruegeria alba]